jgi:DNA-binding GntR family transcriptional regulator
MVPNDGVDIGGTVRERAARELRDRILTGALPAGTRLDLDAITKEFATSRTPVREALLELSYDGLVRVAPRSGITVIGMSPQDVLDSFTILGVLTGQAAAWAAQRVTDEGISRLRELATDVEVHAGEGGIVDANWQFHREIHRASHSRRLMRRSARPYGWCRRIFSGCSPTTNTTRSRSMQPWWRRWPIATSTKPVILPSDTCWTRAGRWPTG